MWQRQKVTYFAIIFYNDKINKNRRGTKNLTKETMFLRKFLEFFLCFLKITFLISNVLETKNMPAMCYEIDRRAFDLELRAFVSDTIFVIENSDRRKFVSRIPLRQ